MHFLKDIKMYYLSFYISYQCKWNCSINKIITELINTIIYHNPLHNKTEVTWAKGQTYNIFPSKDRIVLSSQCIQLHTLSELILNTTCTYTSICEKWKFDCINPKHQCINNLIKIILYSIKFKFLTSFLKLSSKKITLINLQAPDVKKKFFL